MDINKLFREDERPLDNLLSDCGFASIFRTFACIGDSLSSGEFERSLSDGTRGYYDFYEYSWGQFMARAMGSKCYNFSRGGMTAKTFCTEWAEQNGCFDPEKKAQAYIIAMGVNDVSRVLDGSIEFGSLEDIDPENKENNKPTVVGYYAKIIQIYKEISPDAVFFLMTNPKSDSTTAERSAYYDRLRDVEEALCKMFDNLYLLDFRTYAPTFDKDFRDRFYLGGHLNPMGYSLIAKMALSYIDYIIRHNMQNPFFKGAGFIASSYRVQK